MARVGDPAVSGVVEIGEFRVEKGTGFRAGVAVPGFEGSYIFAATLLIDPIEAVLVCRAKGGEEGEKEEGDERSHIF